MNGPSAPPVSDALERAPRPLDPDGGHPDGGRPEGSNCVVYVVDDDPRVLSSLEFLIESVGLRVRTFGSAQDFLAEYDPDVPGCVILDVRMPGMSGLELQEHLRNERVGLPIIFLTGYADVPMAVKALKSGAVDFIEKPANHQSLLDLVQRAVQRDVIRHRTRAENSDLLERYAQLTPREREVMHEVVVGFSSKQIGAELDITYKTVEAHRAKIMKKMEARSVAQLIHMAHLINLPGSGERLADDA